MLGKSRSRNPEVEGRSASLALTNHGALQSQAESSEGHMNSDPFNSFSWKDLHSLGEFISNDGTSLFNDNFIISPEQDSVQGAEGPEHFSGNFYSGSLGEIDIIF
jgi:hypothetical protein